MGPISTIEIWYAQARLAINVCSILVWGEGQPKQRQWFTYVSRVKDKGCTYSCAIFLDVLQRVNWNNVRKCQIWSDKGRHFTGAVTISTLGFTIPYEHRYYLPDDPVPWCVESEQCGGMAKHFKNPCDARYGLQEVWTKEWTKKHIIDDVCGLLHCYSTSYAKLKEKDPSQPNEIFIDFLPPPKVGD